MASEPGEESRSTALVQGGERRSAPGGLAPGRRAGRRLRQELRPLLVVALGGVGGALLRNLVLLVWPTPSGQVPWATLTVNLSGSLLLGFLLGILTVGFPRARLPRLLVGTGFVGAYTTFSTWMVETVLLVRHHHLGVAGAYLGLSLAGGLLAVALGGLLARGALRAERWLAEETGG